MTTRCRLCDGASRFEFVVGDRNRGLGPGEFEYRRCEACDVIAMTAVPEDLERYYAADGYGSAEQPMNPVLEQRERAKLELLADFAPGHTMLEIGPGPGLFTRTAKAAGYEITAIEMDERYCKRLEAELDVRAIQSAAPAEVIPTLEPMDAVVMWHVVEHLPDPWEVLERSVEALKPGGVLALSTPNPDSLQFKLLGPRWVHVDAPRHLQLIPHHTLAQRLTRLGAEHTRTLTADPVGRELSRMGWEYAVRRDPVKRPSSSLSIIASRALAFASSAPEARRLRGAAYTSVFLRGKDRNSLEAS